MSASGSNKARQAAPAGGREKGQGKKDEPSESNDISAGAQGNKGQGNKGQGDKGQGNNGQYNNGHGGKGQGNKGKGANLDPGTSIAQEIRKEHANGNSRPMFTLHGKFRDKSDFAIQVREPVQAVTPETTISEYGGASNAVGELSHTLLVANMDAEESGTIALIAVDNNTDEVDGIVQKNNEKMKFKQKKGGRASVSESLAFTPPAWECSYEDAEENSDRHLMDYEEDHHDDHSQHNHYHERSHHLDGEDMEQAISHVRENLRGSDIRLGKRRRLAGGSYNYQVDMYIEVDQALVNENGGVFNPNTINYVNSLVTGANTIYG